MDSTEQVKAIRALSSEIPLNDFGLPTGIYRTDLLPYHDYRPPSSPHPSTEAPHLQAPQANGVESDVNGTPRGGDGEGVGLTIDHSDVRSDLSLTSVPQDTEEVKPIEIYRIAGFPAEQLHHAFMPLQFDEGFPAFESGQAFWSRLEYEPADAFEAFQKYLQMSLGTPGTIPEFDDEDLNYDGQSATGTRNISFLVAGQFSDKQVLPMLQIFQSYYHLYYWGMRAHAYDLYRIAQYRTQQELRMVETQDEHYVQTRRLRHRLMQYMNNEEEFWDMMTPKTGIDMFKTLTSLERISAGLPASGPINEAAEANRGKPFEVTLRSVAQTHRRVQSVSLDEEGEVLDKALEDPETTEVLQELIIKTGGF